MWGHRVGWLPCERDGSGVCKVFTGNWTYTSHMKVGPSEVALTLVLMVTYITRMIWKLRPLNEVAADKIRAYHTDYNNRPSNAISFMTVIATMIRLGD